MCPSSTGRPCFPQSNDSRHSSNLPPGSYCSVNQQQKRVSCGIDVTYCCLGSYNLGSIPQDWKLRMGIQQRAADTSNATATAAAAAASRPGSNSSSQSGDDSEAYVVALAVVLPVLAVVFGAALFAIRRAVRSAKSKHQQQPSGSQDHGRTADCCSTPLNPLAAAALQLQVADTSTPAAAAALAVHDPSSHSDEQPLLGSIQAHGSAVLSPFAQPSLQQQLESQLNSAAAAPPAGAGELGHLAGSGSGSHARSVVSLWLMRGRTMPADLLARAVNQFNAAQQQQEGEGVAGAAAGAVPKSSSNSPEPPDPPLKR
jgi:hypothetical protein